MYNVFGNYRYENWVSDLNCKRIWELRSNDNLEIWKDVSAFGEYSLGYVVRYIKYILGNLVIMIIGNDVSMF